MTAHKKSLQEFDRAKKKHIQSRWYTQELNSLLGNTWAMFYCILGGRMTGKSYALADYMCRQKHRKKDKVKLYWFRISETSTKFMLANKAQKLIDPDLVRKHDLDLSTKGQEVFDHGSPFMTVLPLSAMAKNKGVAFYDKDYDGEYIIVLDEFQLEEGEKRTSFDILYNFIGMLENIVRTTKNNIRVFLVGNTLEEASSILKAFNFLPQGFGRFRLKRKKCIIDNISPTEEYLKDREGSAADILGGKEMSNYTNELRQDVSLVDRSRRTKPQYIIKFSKLYKDWYVVWDNNIISRYKNQPCPSYVLMTPYLDGRYSADRKNAVIEMFDNQAYKFDTLISLQYFQDALKKLRKK